MKNKVGILTWHYYDNVGSNLQAYALSRAIVKSGFDYKFVNYRYKKFHDNKIKSLIKKILICFDKICPNKLPYKYSFKTLQFQNKYFNQTEICFDKDKLNKFNDEFDMFVCGSDQIWAPIVFDEVYFLDFVKSKYKFSYAPSIGLDYIPNELKDNYKKLLSSFDCISVREEKGQELLKELGYKSQVVLDPSFLLTKDEWVKLTNKRKINDEYVFCYFLGDNVRFREIAREYCKKNNKKLVIYSANLNDKNYSDYHFEKLGPKEFLTYLYFSSHMFTDSFHGVSLSILLEKQFNCFMRFTEGDSKNQNSRIINILKLFDLNNQLINLDNYDITSDINYKSVSKKVSKEREKSLNFLVENLKRGSSYERCIRK